MNSKKVIKIFTIVLLVLFGPGIFLVYVWLEGQSSPTSNNWAPVNLEFEAANKIKSKWFFKFISFLFHSEKESFFVNLFRLLIIDIPANAILIGGLGIISILWTIYIFKFLFGIDLKPIFDEWAR